MSMIEDLRELLGEKTWCSLARVEEPPKANPFALTAAELMRVRLQPGGTLCEARVAVQGAGAGRGDVVPYSQGDTVVVLFPGGKRSQAIVVGALHTAASPRPVASGQRILQYPGGVELRSADGLPSESIIKGGFLDGLQGFLAAFDVFLTAAGAATTAPQIAAAALAFDQDLRVASFRAAMAATTSGDEPGPPYASTSHKVTD